MLMLITITIFLIVIILVTYNVFKIKMVIRNFNEFINDSTVRVITGSRTEVSKIIGRDISNNTYGQYNATKRAMFVITTTSYKKVAHVLLHEYRHHMQNMYMSNSEFDKDVELLIKGIISWNEASHEIDAEKYAYSNVSRIL